MLNTEDLKNDKNYHGFTHTLPNNDERIPFYLKQKEEQGFDSTEIWSLYSTITKFVLPRLKEFRETTSYTYPMGMEQDEWTKTIDKMIIAFEIIDENENGVFNNKEFKKIKQGLNLFSKHFMNLWY